MSNIWGICEQRSCQALNLFLVLPHRTCYSALLLCVFKIWLGGWSRMGALVPRTPCSLEPEQGVRNSLENRFIQHFLIPPGDLGKFLPLHIFFCGGERQRTYKQINRSDRLWRKTVWVRVERDRCCFWWANWGGPLRRGRWMWDLNEARAHATCILQRRFAGRGSGNGRPAYRHWVRNTVGKELWMWLPRWECCPWMVKKRNCMIL